jgi:hypothetical protein
MRVCLGVVCTMLEVPWQEAKWPMLSVKQEARGGSWRARIVKTSIHEHCFPSDGYNCMIQSEYIATGNQLGEICRNGNEKAKWQLKGAEIVVLLYSFGNWQPTDDFYFVAIFES